MTKPALPQMPTVEKKLELKRNVVKKFSIRSGVRAGKSCTMTTTDNSGTPPSTNHNPARVRR